MWAPAVILLMTILLMLLSDIFDIVIFMCLMLTTCFQCCLQHIFYVVCFFFMLSSVYFRGCHLYIFMLPSVYILCCLHIFDVVICIFLMLSFASIYVQSIMYLFFWRILFYSWSELVSSSQNMAALISVTPLCLKLRVFFFGYWWPELLLALLPFLTPPPR